MLVHPDWVAMAVHLYGVLYTYSCSVLLVLGCPRQSSESVQSPTWLIYWSFNVQQIYFPAQIFFHNKITNKTGMIFWSLPQYSCVIVTAAPARPPVFGAIL